MQELWSWPAPYCTSCFTYTFWYVSMSWVCTSACAPVHSISNQHLQAQSTSVQAKGGSKKYGSLTGVMFQIKIQTQPRKLPIVCVCVCEICEIRRAQVSVCKRSHGIPRDAFTPENLIAGSNQCRAKHPLVCWLSNLYKILQVKKKHGPHGSLTAMLKAMPALHGKLRSTHIAQASDRCNIVPDTYVNVLHRI